jgi:phytoene desaturase
MNYADFGMGTWHPKTGMFDVVRAMESLARELGYLSYQLNIEK